MILAMHAFTKNQRLTKPKVQSKQQTFVREKFAKGGHEKNFISYKYSIHFQTYDLCYLYSIDTVSFLVDYVQPYLKINETSFASMIKDN